MDYNNFNNNYYGYNPYDNFDSNLMDATLNPMTQYEQNYMYYKYLTQVMEYKIKCKEYEKLGGKENRTERRVE